MENLVNNQELLSLVIDSFIFCILTSGDASGLNCKYFLEMLGYYPSIPNIPSCARVSKSVCMSEMSLDLKYAR